MVRAIVTGGFLLVAAIIISVSLALGVDTATGTLLINLGTEIVGIVLTVAIVEWFFERRRLQGRARQLAWDVLHGVIHAVWVWQGGPREMDTDEILGVLAAVGPDDPLPDFTEGLLLSVGTRSRRMLIDEPATVAAMPHLLSGLEHLSRLSSMRDGTPMPARKVADILEEGTSTLARSVSRPTEPLLARLIRHRDPSVEGQERRHFGGSAPPVPRRG